MERLKTEEYHDSIRGYFAGELYNQMIDNKDIFCITADLGYGMLDKIKRDFPERFINVGAAEQTLIGVGVGLAEMDKIPIVYSITPFLLYRSFETIRNYINKEQVPVKLVGSGRDDDYKDDGFSHSATDVKSILDAAFSNVVQLWPETKEEIPNILQQTISNGKPTFISLKR